MDRSDSSRPVDMSRAEGSGLSDEELMLRIVKRDEDALKALLERYATRLYSVVKRTLGTLSTNQDIEEVLSDSFLRVWNLANSFEPSRGTVAAWLAHLAMYQGLSHRKHMIRLARIRSKILSVDTNSESQFIEASYSTADVQEQVHLLVRCLEQLPAKDAYVITRRYIDDAGYAEIAAEIGGEMGAVRQRIHRARRRLRSLMDAATAARD